MRAFVAIDVPAERFPSLNRLCVELGAVRGVKPVEPELLHLTIQFLGDIGASEVHAIEAPLAAVASAHTVFPVELRDVGAFPSTSDPRVIWVGCLSRDLAGFAEGVRDALAASGSRADRPFSAHVTIGRVKRSPERAALAALVDSGRDLFFGRFEVTEVRLKRSDLSPGGPRYSDLRVWPLGPAPTG